MKFFAQILFYFAISLFRFIVLQHVVGDPADSVRVNAASIRAGSLPDAHEELLVTIQAAVFSQDLLML